MDFGFVFSLLPTNLELIWILFSVEPQKHLKVAEKSTFLLCYHRTGNSDQDYDQDNCIEFEYSTRNSWASYKYEKVLCYYASHYIVSITSFNFYDGTYSAMSSCGKHFAQNKNKKWKMKEKNRKREKRIKNHSNSQRQWTDLYSCMHRDVNGCKHVDMYTCIYM